MFQEENPSHEAATSHQFITDDEILQEENPSLESSDGSPNHSNEATTSHQFITDYVIPTSVSEEDMIKRICQFIEPMKEMFAKYFCPEQILFHLSLEDSAKQRIRKDSQGDLERGMRSLLETLVRMQGPIKLEFYRLITATDEGYLPASLLSAKGNLCQGKIAGLKLFIFELVQQKNIEKLTSTDWEKIIDAMVEKEFMQKPEDRLDTIENLLRDVWKNNPDWPFFLWRTLQDTRRDLFASESTEDDSNPIGCEPGVESCSYFFEPAIESSHKLQVTQEKAKAVKDLMTRGVLRPQQVDFKEKRESTKVKSVLSSKRDGYISDGEDSEEETMKKMPVNDSSNSTVDLNLKEFQIELTEHALKGHNTIIYARTGCGKTRVALDIITKHLDQGDKKVCFLTRTVPLAVQQYNTIRNKLPGKYKMKKFTGDAEHRRHMHLLLEELHIVVLTPMILQNHITRGNLESLSVFSLLVFDECHHATGSDPYNILMSSYVDKKLQGGNNLPQVVGLTASFPMDKADDEEKARMKVLQLCANLDARFISKVIKNVDELNEFSPIPTETTGYLRARESDESYKCILAVMDNLQKEAEKCAEDMENDEIKKIVDVICSNLDRKKKKYCIQVDKLLKATEQLPSSSEQNNLNARLLMTIAQYLKNYHLALEAHDLIHVKDVINYLQKSFTRNGFDELQTKREIKFYDQFKELKGRVGNLHQDENKNLLLLIEVIKEKMLGIGNSRGIIFVRSRAIAEALASWLNRCENKEIRNLNTHIFTGTSGKESLGGMTQSQQNVLVGKFRKGDVRLLVATSVAEEGLDVPDCNLVIRYNYVGNEITIIHTRGRSRYREGHSVLLAMEETWEREECNRKLIHLMEKSVQSVRDMSEEDYNKIVKGIQESNIRERLSGKSSCERKCKDTKFTMTCKRCKKLRIESDKLRTLHGKHRVVIDRNVWNRTMCFIIDQMYMEEVEINAIVKCGNDIGENAKCGWKLGRLVFFNERFFLAVGIKHFNLTERKEDGGEGESANFEKWKNVPYSLKELSNEDIDRYLSFSGIQEEGHASASYVCPSAAKRESSELEQCNDEGTCAGTQETEPPRNSNSTIDQESAPMGSLSPYSSSDSHHETEVKELA